MFLFDDEKLRILLASVAAKDHLKKYGQSFDVATFRLAQPLIASLEQQIDPAIKIDATSYRGSLSGTPTQPDVSNFRTLGDFIRWASDNKLTWKDKRFAWTATESDVQKPTDARRYDAMHPTRERGDTRESLIDQFDVDQKGLVGYLTSIRDNEALGNKVLEVLIKANINELNSLNIFSGPPIDPKSSALLTKDILDDFIVDGFGSSNLLEEDQWNRGLESAPLFVTSSVTLKGKDVKSVGAFQAWFGTLKTINKEKFEASATGAEGIVSALSPDGDPCLVFYILHKRANYLKDRAAGFAQSNPTDFGNYAKYVDAYLAMLDRLQGIVKDPATGASCSLTSPTVGPEFGTKAPGKGADKPFGRTDTSTEETVESGFGVPGGAPGRTPGIGRGSRGPRDITGPKPDLMDDIVNTMPLRYEVVMFSLISTFLNTISLLDDPEINKLILDVQQSIGSARRNTKSSKDSLNLNVSWQIDPKTKEISNPLLIDMEGPNTQASFCNYIVHIEDILKGILEIITLFKNKYERHLSSQQKTLIISQIGSGAFSSSSLYGYNIRQVHKMKQWGKCPTI